MGRKTTKNDKNFRHFCRLSDKFRTSGAGPRHVNDRSGKAAQNCLRVNPSTSSSVREWIRFSRNHGLSVSAAFRLSGQTREQISHPQIHGCCVSCCIWTSVRDCLLCVSADRHFFSSAYPLPSAFAGHARAHAPQLGHVSLTDSVGGRSRSVSIVPIKTKMP